MKMINYENVCGIIVSFNGSQTIESSIISLKNNVNSIIVIDNASNDDTILRISKLNLKNITLIQNLSNLGLAEGLNIGYQEAKKQGYMWILTLDQDTVLNENVVSEISKVECYFSTKSYKVGIYSVPLKSSGLLKKNFFCIKNTVITSGNIVSIYALDIVGGFTTKLFIDSIDFDLGLKLKRYKFKIIQCNLASMSHNIGNLTTISFLFFKFKIYLHSHKRKYFIIRNHLYLIKNYFFISPFFLLKKSVFLFFLVVKSIILEPRKISNIKYLLLGFYHGLINNFDNNIV